MKPIKLRAAYKDYIWGGEKLRTIYGKETDTTPLAESWELSTHPDGQSIIDGGEYDGKSMSEYIKDNAGCLGTYCRGEELPILIKLIDAADNLSVQVHPSDELAKKWENQNGKTEMWYVMQADNDAKMTCGVKRDITEEELKKAVEQNALEELLNTVSSKKGDVFFVEAGTVHAIGKGNVIAEIQQNSNVTYRLYDYGRVGKDGKPRELHIKKGVAAATLKKTAPRKTPFCSDGTRLLGSCEYFAVKEMTLSGKKSLFADEKSYTAFVVTEGEATLATKDFAQTLKAGETVFIPANMGEYELSGKATLLKVTNSPNYYVKAMLSEKKIVAEVVDEYGTAYAKSSKEIAATASYEKICADMAECAICAANESGIVFEDIKCVFAEPQTPAENEKRPTLFENADFARDAERLLGKKVYMRKNG